jgi:IS30 family transposase
MGKEMGMSIEKIAKLKGRSTRTIWNEIKKHNESIDRLGYCERCRRVKSPLQYQKV